MLPGGCAPSLVRAHTVPSPRIFAALAAQSINDTQQSTSVVTCVLRARNVERRIYVYRMPALPSRVRSPKCLAPPRVAPPGRVGLPFLTTLAPTHFPVSAPLIRTSL